jgi:4Fe-4S ferredoxin
MNVRLRKRETAQVLELTLEMYQERVELRLHKDLCLRCEVCSLVCPRGAVQLLLTDQGAELTIDPHRCVLCELCAHFCPTGAVSLWRNGVRKTIFADHQGLAPFYPKVEMDKGKCPEPCGIQPEGEVHWCRQQQRLVGREPLECPKHCHRCLTACPRQAIVLDPSGTHTLPEVDRCLRCTQCLEVCDFGALTVTPQFRGEVQINDSLCPPDCRVCIDACPVQAIVREGERVFLKTERCSLCGVCRTLCDYEAVSVVRREVVAAPGEFCEAWEAAVARLQAGRKAR